MVKFDRNARRGWSLVELVLASAIAVVLGLIVLTVFRTVAMVRETQQGISVGEAARYAASIQLVDDVTNCFKAEIDDSTFLLREGAAVAGMRERPSRLQLSTYVRMPGEPDPEWHMPVEVIWQVREEKQEALLERVERPLSGPDVDHAQTNVLARAIQGFRIEARQADGWVSEFEPGKDLSWPEEIRFRINTEAEEDWTRVYIPVAIRVPSSIDRSSAAP